MKTRYQVWSKRVLNLVLAVTLPLFFASSLYATDGHFLHGEGPVNEAMGGADTGVCLDVSGSIAWNPACMTQFQGKHLELYGTIFIPWRSLSSTVDANAFGTGMPPVTLSGTTTSHTDMSIIPGIAFTTHKKGSHNAFFFGLLAVSGFGVDYDQSNNLSNPILSPQAPDGFGFGHIRSEYMLMTFPIGISRQLTKHVSMGVSIIPALSMLEVEPAPFAAPVTAGSTMPYYMSSGHDALAPGFGASVGIHYTKGPLSLGVSYRSPVWLSHFKWTMKDKTGGTHDVKFQMNLPQVISFGVGLKATPTTTIGIDTRWFDYGSTAGFDKVGFKADGAVAGFGWRNIWAVGVGVQQKISDSTKVMVGYNYSQNPVPAKYTFFNMPAPAIVQHHLTAGITRHMHGFDVNLAYYHAFKNSITGPWISPMGQIPGTSVTSKMSENAVTIGLAKSF